MQKLINIQKKLKAPKSNTNSFGKYKYRSCEDILEAVKPLLAEEKCTLTLRDDVVLVGDRFYIKATAKITDGTEEIEVTAFARESEEKKGMDDSQVTGTASSYARKYALNGLFLIDDTKDADTDEHTKVTEKNVKLATKLEKDTFMAVCKDLGVEYSDILKQVGVEGKMTQEDYAKCMVVLNDIEQSRKEQK